MSDLRADLTDTVPPHCGFDPPMNGDKTWSRHAFVRELPPRERFNLQRWHSLAVFGSLGLILVAGKLAYFFTDDSFDFYQPDQFGAVLWFAIGLGATGMILLLAHGRLLRNLMRRRVGRREGRLFDPATEASLVVEIEKIPGYRKLRMNADDMGLICARNGWLDMELASHRARFPLHELRIRPVTAHTGCVELHYENEVPAWRAAATVLIIQNLDPRDLVPGLASSHLERWIRTGEIRICRRCKYDLRSVMEDKCPECGAACVPTYQPPKSGVTGLPIASLSRDRGGLE